MILLDYYIILLLVLSGLWIILNHIPSVFKHYNYSTEEISKNEINSRLVKKFVRFEKFLKFFCIVLIFPLSIVLLHFLLTQNNSLQKTVLSIFSNLYIVSFVLGSVYVVVVTIWGNEKFLSSFDLHHNSFFNILSVLILFGLGIFPNLDKTINNFLKIQLKSSFSDDVYKSAIYIGVNASFLFFIFVISFFCIKDIQLLLSKRKTTIRKIEVNHTVRNITNSYIKWKNSIWLFYRNHSFFLSFLIIPFYLLILFVEFLLNTTYKVVKEFYYYTTILFHYILKSIGKIVNFESGYIIALSARISLIIAMSITFIYFKYKNIISSTGIDIFEFVFTIFLLPLIFNSIVKFQERKSKKNKL